jgi:hypothetical protein
MGDVVEAKDRCGISTVLPSQAGKPEGKKVGGPLVSFDRSKYAGNDDADDNAKINSNVNANFNDNVITMTKPTSTATSIILEETSHRLPLLPRRVGLPRQIAKGTV